MLVMRIDNGVVNGGNITNGGDCYKYYEFY